MPDQRRLSYFVASSLDGFIAGPDGSDPSSWWPMTDDYLDFIRTEYPETLPGPARQALGVTDPGHHFDTVVEGRRSFEIGLAAGLPNAYPHLRHLVVSTTSGVSIRFGRRNRQRRSDRADQAAQGRTGQGHLACRWRHTRGEPATGDRRTDHQTRARDPGLGNSALGSRRRIRQGDLVSGRGHKLPRWNDPAALRTGRGRLRPRRWRVSESSDGSMTPRATESSCGSRLPTDGGSGHC